MGLFGNSEWDDIKTEYRNLKVEIAEHQAELDIAFATNATSSTEKYQYLVREDIEQPDMNNLGSSGWELVNFASYTVGFGIGGNTSMKVHLRYVFKRAMSEATPEIESRIAALKVLTERKAELATIIELRGYKAT